MSGVSKDLDLKSTKNKNHSLNETDKTEKRNYCYVCQVQCTAQKNLKAHIQGRKHLNKLSNAAERQSIGKSRKKGQNVPASKIGVEKSNLVQRKSKVLDVSDTHNKMPLNSETLETNDSHSNHSNFMSNNHIKSRKPPVNNNRGFSRIANYRSTYRNNHSDIPPYYNSHYHGNQRPFYNSHNYYRWNSSYPRPSLLESPDYVNVGVIPENFYEFEQNNSGYRGHHLYPLRNPENFVENKNPLICQNSSNVDDAYGKGRLESYVSQEESLNSRGRINNSHIIPSSNERENTSSKDSNQPSTFSNDAHTQSSKIVQQIISPMSAIGDKKAGEKKRIRSRSLSSTESNFSYGKKKRDQNENQSADLDEAEQQKIKDWTNTLLETSHGQISRLIHPSNYKDKAAVNHLITNLSKSKRKENLSRLKFRSDSICSNETNDDEKEIDEVDNISETEHFMEVTSTKDNSKVENVEHTPPLKKSKNNSNSKSSKPNEKFSGGVESTTNETPRKSTEPSEKLEEANSLSLNKKSKGKQKTSVSTDSSKQAKRKSLNISRNNVGKKRRSSDTHVENIGTSKSKEQLSIPDPSASSSTSTAGITELHWIRRSDTHAENIGTTKSKEHLSVPDPSASSSTSTVGLTEILNLCFSPKSALKKEVSESLDENPSQSCPVPNSINNQSQNLDFNSGFSVETLINLFATGDVKVKKEFNDPAIEAIKSLDPSILLKACSHKFPSQNKSNGESQVHTESTPKTKSTEPSSLNDIDKDDRNCFNPVISGAAATSASTVATPSYSSVSPSSNLPFVNPDVSNPSVKSANRSDFSGIEDINFMPKNTSNYSPHLKKLIKVLQEISSQEENVKQRLVETKEKINEYQALLEDWKNKKKELQDEEEHLRKKRVDIIESMHEAVKTAGEINNEKEPDTTPEPLFTKRQCHPSESSEHSSQPTVQIKKPSNVSASVSKPAMKQKNKLPQSSESDEIAILPLPVKTEKPELIVIDCEDTDETSQNVIDSEQKVIFTDTPSKNVPSIFDMKSLTAHPTIVNCLLVFEDYLYTCSNDRTAKRFSLKDPLETVTYLHTGKNITEIVVEKVQSEALVFTSCSSRVISLFIASTGTKIKTFYQPCPIMSICKGWGKFYSGMADGSINVYNWKYEEKEIIRSELPASRIATAHQGRLHVLIILCSNSTISVRDAETGLLIRYIKGFVKIPAWLTVHNDLAYLSSSDKTLTILDIVTGRAEKKLYVTSHTTGLAVYEDFIFTISYSGLVTCYNKEKMSDKRTYYGAGRSGLTCIHVYQDWVFTGNRKGDIYVFKFDQSDAFRCQIGQCSMTFGLKEDLAFHVEKDHVSKKKIPRCNWGICFYKFSADYGIEDKMRHMNRHIFQNVIKC